MCSILYPFVLKASPDLLNQRIHQLVHALHHDNKVVDMYVHALDVSTTEIAAIQNGHCAEI